MGVIVTDKVTTVTVNIVDEELVSEVDRITTIVSTVAPETVAIVAPFSITVGGSINVQDAPYNAKADFIKLGDGAMTAGSNIFQSFSSNFTSNDINKVIDVQGVGTSGASLAGTISSLVVGDSTQVHLSFNAITTASNKSFRYGTDDSIAIQSAINDANAAGGGIVKFTGQKYFANVIIKKNVILEGCAIRDVEYGKPSTQKQSELHPAPGSTHAVIRDNNVYAGPFALKNIRINGDWTSPNVVNRPVSSDVPQVNGIELKYDNAQAEFGFLFQAGFHFENVHVENMNGVGIMSTKAYSECLVHILSVLGCKWSGQLFHGTDSWFYHCEWGGNVATTTLTTDNPVGLAGLIVFGSNNTFVGGGAWYNGGSDVSPGIGDGVVCINTNSATGEKGSTNTFTNFDNNDNNNNDWVFKNVFGCKTRNCTTGGAYSSSLFMVGDSTPACAHNDIELYLRGSDRYQPLGGVALQGTHVLHNTISFNLDIDSTDTYGASDTVAPTYNNIVLLNNASLNTNKVSIHGHSSHRISAFSVPGPTVNPGWFNGDLQAYTITGDVTIGPVVTGRYSPSPGADLIFVLTQDGTGGHAVVWDSSYWGAPLVNQGIGTVTVVHFINISTTITPIWRRSNAPQSAIARVYNNADIVLTSGVATTLTFNSERWDSSRFHDLVINPSRLTIPATGFYRVGTSIQFLSNATGYRDVEIFLNGTTLIARSLVPAANGNGTIVPVSTEYLFNAGDYVEVQATQTSGGNLNVKSLVNYSPEFWISQLQ